MPDESKPKTEAVEIPTLTVPAVPVAPVKTNDAMIEYLSKEIETMSNNIMNSRNRISFSLWVGPFLFLASVIVGSKKEGFDFQNPCLLAWILLGAAAFLFFFGIAFIVALIEEGAWIKCNEWRRCIIRLQLGEEISADTFETLVLYQQLESKVWKAYLGVFAICFLMFCAVVYFISQLLSFGGPAAPIVN